MNRLCKITVVAAGSLLAGVAFAATTTSNIAVFATVGGGGVCTVFGFPLDFGSVDGSVQVDTPTSFEVNCTSGIIYTVAFDAGLNVNGSGLRTVQNPAGDPIVYGLVDLVSGLEVGDACGANTYPLGSCLGGAGTGIVQTFTMTAIMPDAVSQPTNIYTAGTDYFDNIIVTLEF